MLWGFLLVILGLFAMMTPAVSGIATTFMLGALLLISGLATVIYAFGSDSFGQGVLRFLFGGSFNFDRRSLIINNEIGLLFHDPAVAGASAKSFEENVHKVAFEVSFSNEGGSGNMEWTGGQGGPDTVMKKEPYATTMQKLMVGVLKWLPIDSQL
jgi:hypothetical protein